MKKVMVADWISCTTEQCVGRSTHSVACVGVAHSSVHTYAIPIIIAVILIIVVAIVLYFISQSYMY